MDFSKVKVLLTDGGARQTLTILHGLKEIGCHVTVMCASKINVCYVSRLPDEKLLHPDAAGSSEGFVNFLLEEVKTGKYDVLFPVAEMTTNKVTQHEEELKQYVRLACAPRSSYEQAYNKQRTFEVALDNDIPCPYTRRENQSVEDFLSKAKFPLIIKPHNGFGSIGFHKFEKREDFEPYIQEHNIDLDHYVLQEFVDYEKRLGTILFVDQNNNVAMAYANEVLRWYPIDAGTACCIRSIDYPEVLEKSADLLKAMNWRGVAAISFMVDRHTNEPKLLEINGRIPASIRLSHQCGFNVAKLMIEMVYDEEVEAYPMNTVFGQVSRHFQADMGWFVHSPTRFKCEPSWFSWKNAKDVVFWRNDPLPWFYYTFGKVLSYKEIMNKRRH